MPSDNKIRCFFERSDDSRRSVVEDLDRNSSREYFVRISFRRLVTRFCTWLMQSSFITKSFTLSPRVVSFVWSFSLASLSRIELRDIRLTIENIWDEFFSIITYVHLLNRSFFLHLAFVVVILHPCLQQHMFVWQLHKHLSHRRISTIYIETLHGTHSRWRFSVVFK